MNKDKLRALAEQLLAALEDDEDEKPTPAPGTAEGKRLAARNAQRQRMCLPPLGPKPKAITTGQGELKISHHAFALSRAGRARA